MRTFNFFELFERVVILNLRRRPDRLLRLLEALLRSNWPFREPVIFAAVDGNLVPPPPEWKSGAGAWGCMRSHQRILKEALNDGINSVLVLEDDICFVEGFAEKVKIFLEAVPRDWDQLMLGGQHIHLGGPPILVAPGVYRCTDCERTHCYAVRGAYMRKLYQRWIRGGPFDGSVHCDHIMGRDPDLQRRHRVYAPTEFLVGQEGDASDINGRINPRKFWNPPGPDLPVIHLEAPADVAHQLRFYGLHRGFARDIESDIDLGLQKLCAETDPGSEDRVGRLRTWLDQLQWEVASDHRLICTVWHPALNHGDVQRASRWPVYPVKAGTLDEALSQVPETLRRPPQIPLAEQCVVHFDGPPKVMDAMRREGWHNGYQRSPDGYDVGLARIIRDPASLQTKVAQLRTLIRLLQREAERIPNGVAVLWHPELDGSLVKEAVSERIVHFAATDPNEALAAWEHAKSQTLQP